MSQATLWKKTKQARVRRHQARLEISRLVVHVSGKHTYAQIVSPDAKVLVSASTAEKELRDKYAKNGGNITAAGDIGRRLAEKALAYGDEKIGKLGFDRGFKRYQGRVKALAEAARESGLKF